MVLESKSGEKLSRSEAITTLVHYYRAEVTRSLAWRDRLDLTTNWAVGAAAALLGVAFSHSDVHHSLFFFAFAIIYTLLLVEARRYRFYDAYEYRVRLMHQNFFYGVLTGRVDLEENSFWIAELASDLRFPQYKMDFSYAMGRRLLANYIYLFAILITGWLIKVQLHPQPARSVAEYLEHASLWVIPGWAVLMLLFIFLLHLLHLLRIGYRPRGGRDILYSGSRARERELDQG